MNYIYQYPDWPQFTWDDRAINLIFGEVRHLQGKIIGRMSALGLAEKGEASLSNLTLDVVKSSEIEGESLNYEEVRSSIARRLGIDVGGLIPSSRHVEGIVEMMLDATQRCSNPLSQSRLFGWHAALFPIGYSGPYRIDVGKYRSGEMQIVSGALGKERIRYDAVKAASVEYEMKRFLEWINNERSLDPVLKAAIAHFWFIIIHPFDDGNGRIARAIADMLLARAENSSQRFYSMSRQILAERQQYYDVLQRVQHSSGDITDWIVWFLNCLNNAMLSSEALLERTLEKAAFWDQNASTSINERQRRVINMLFAGFDGKLKSSKWAKINKTSTDTALRDIKDLIEKGILRQTPDTGRNASYELVDVRPE